MLPHDVDIARGPMRTQKLIFTTADVCGIVLKLNLTFFRRADFPACRHLYMDHRETFGEPPDAVESLSKAVN